jgi:uncharacterized protein DUF4301
MTLEAPGATFSRSDLDQLERRGITLEDARYQIELLLQPPPPLSIDRACTIGDGIARIADEEHEELLKLHHEAAQSGSCHWFVPASGAASRMFKDLVVALAPPVPEKSRKKKPVPENLALKQFLHEIRRFPFYADLDKALGGKLAALAEAGEHRPILETMLAAAGLGFADKPKGLMPFHAYDGVTCTAFEEHLVEAGQVVRDAAQRARLHFTVSPEHMDAFHALFEKVRGRYELQLGVHFDVGFSVQNPKTDTLALDAEGKLFRDPEGMLLFRPGGHGALLDNLAKLAGDIVLVKNIDNIARHERSRDIVPIRRQLSGLLAAIEREVHDAIERLRDGAGADDALRSLESRFGIRAGGDAMAALNRPLRVCGVIRTGEHTGGRAFWVDVPGRGAALQIVESAEIDTSDEKSTALFDSAPFFNPVDIVCSLRDVDGMPFDLARFTSPERAIVASKSLGGVPSLVYEHPGLWNGGMGLWNTVFVEVPGFTFNPVKSLADLWTEGHRM